MKEVPAVAVRTITTRLKLEGESEHRAALKRISSEYQLHKSELDKVSAQYKEQANTLSALEGREPRQRAGRFPDRDRKSVV